MLIDDILEDHKTLPVRKGALRSAQSDYISLLAVMKPRDFIRLTTSRDDDINIIMGHEFSQIQDYDPNHYDLPYLNVLYPSGKVIGHEGRHRAAMVIKAGGISFPVLIQFREEFQYIVTYEEYDATRDEGEDKVRVCATPQEQDAFIEELKRLNKELDQPYSYYRIQARTLGGMTLRGHPERSDLRNWKYAAWKPSDMPRYLIGQFNSDVRVPTSTMRVGVIKGQKHYAEDL